MAFFGEQPFVDDKMAVLIFDNAHGSEKKRKFVLGNRNSFSAKNRIEMICPNRKNKFTL